MTQPVLLPPLDQVTTAFLDLARGAGRPVWDSAYGGSPTAPTYPYHIGYRIPGGSSDATPDMSGQRRTFTLVYQLTTVAGYRNVCEAAATAAANWILARGPSGFVHPIALPTGWRNTDRRPAPDMPGIDRVGNEPNAVYSLPARYYLTLAPA